MYGEELLMAEIARANGKKSMVNYDLHVYHNENQTTGLVNSKRKQKWKSAFMEYLFQKFFKNG